jgi:SanA protein
VGSNLYVGGFSKRIAAELSELPQTKAVLVLGTARYLRNGNPNPYFTNRISAAADVYKAGKAKKILVSGDNGRPEYNEPLDMQNALIEAGVPEDDIVLDYAGFRTFDSVVRCKKIWGQDSVIIVSQGGHLKRALYIASRNGLYARGYEAESPPISIRMRAREYLATLRAVLDCTVLRTSPKFLGEREDLGA